MVSTKLPLKCGNHAKASGPATHFDVDLVCGERALADGVLVRCAEKSPAVVTARASSFRPTVLRQDGWAETVVPGPRPRSESGTVHGPCTVPDARDFCTAVFPVFAVAHVTQPIGLPLRTAGPWLIPCRSACAGCGTTPVYPRASMLAGTVRGVH